MNIQTKVARKILAIKYTGGNLEDVVEFLNNSYQKSGYSTVSLIDNFKHSGEYLQFHFDDFVVFNFKIGDYFIISKPSKNNLKHYTKIEFDEKFVEL